jgi:hypothetical protein
MVGEADVADIEVYITMLVNTNNTIGQLGCIIKDY